MSSAFVSREKELGQLGEMLARAVDGRGQVCFVTGEAGFGKTSLTMEFARRAQERHAELLVARGDCNAQTGRSDPYLPFREVLAMLAGDSEERLATGVTTVENASRLRDFLRVSSQILAEVAPDIVDMFIPGVGVATKAGKIVVGETNRLRRERSTVTTAQAAPSMVDVQAAADQGRVFEQFTAALIALAKRRPLILVLDDLHWIDESSASLLFHLGRRLEGSRILVIGTYRPEDVSLGRGDSRHPLAQVITELKGHYGNLLVALGDETADETRRFVDQLVDLAPNRLDEAFRRELHRRTRGHPLFTTELLQDLRERGELVKDADGHWVLARTLDWTSLPARVEGVIEERIQRMRQELQDILSVASVEGETFTAQVIVRLQELNERQLLRTLTQELDRQHRLVAEEGSERLGATLISQFRFRHQMFQQYFYEHLGTSERELLHEDVARILETLHAGRSERIAMQLARHYELARLDDKAAAAYLQAGRAALEVYAHAEATSLAQRGIAALQRLGDVSVQAGLLLELNLLHGEALQHGGRFGESMETYRQTAELAARLGAPEALARAALGYDEPRWRCNLLEPIASQLLNRALDSLPAEDSVLRVCLLSHLVRSSQGSMPAEQLSALLDEAIAMAHRLGDPQALIEALRTRLNLDRSPQGIDDRLRLIDEMIEVARRIGHKPLLLDLVSFRIYDLVALGDLAGWVHDMDVHEGLAAEVAEPFHTYCHRAMRAAQLINTGRFDEAEHAALDALATGQGLGVDNAEGVMGMQMFTIRREQGRLRELEPLVRHFVEERGAGAAWRPGLALIYAELDRETGARQEFERLAADGFAGLPRDSLWLTCISYLAEVCDYLQDGERARILYGLLLPHAEQTVVVGSASVCLGAAARFLGQLAAVNADWPNAESHFERALEIDGRMQAAPWLAKTQFQYSRMLLRRGRREDVERAGALLAEAAANAQRKGMNGLLSHIGEGATC